MNDLRRRYDNIIRFSCPCAWSSSDHAIPNFQSSNCSSVHISTITTRLRIFNPPFFRISYLFLNQAFKDLRVWNVLVSSLDSCILCSFRIQMQVNLKYRGYKMNSRSNAVDNGKFATLIWYMIQQETKQEDRNAISASLHICLIRILFFGAEGDEYEQI